MIFETTCGLLSLIVKIVIHPKPFKVDLQISKIKELLIFEVDNDLERFGFVVTGTAIPLSIIAVPLSFDSIVLDENCTQEKDLFHFVVANQFGFVVKET